MADPGGSDSNTTTQAKPSQTFTFHLPDGKSASITAPQGTTNEQAWGYLTQQHPEYGQGNQGGQGDQEPSFFRPDPTPIDPKQMPDPLAAVAHGAIGVPVEAGRIVNEWGAKPMGWDLGNLVPESMQRGWDALTQRANRGGGTEIGEDIGSALPFAATGPMKALPWAGRVLGRSVIPSLLQPTTGPLDPLTKGLQTLIGTGAGEAMHGLSWLAGTPLGKWALEQLRGKAAADKEAQAAARDKLQRTVTGRATQLDTAAQQAAARDTEEQARQKAFSEATAEHARTSAEAATVEARNQARQQVIDRLNQRNELFYRGERAKAGIAGVRQESVPRQATQGLLNDARGLIGLRPLEYDLTRESAPQALKDVGDELNRIYGQMSFDPNQGGWLTNAQQTQHQIMERLRQDPRAQAMWQQVFQDKAFMPGLRAEEGMLPGWDAMGRPRVRREPASGRRTSLPMGQRSGPISGDQLSRMMSVLTKAQQQFGLEAQRGGGGIYRDMAEGLARMRKSVEDQLDKKFPAQAEERRLANQAYFLTSRVMDAIDVHGTATPEQLLTAFKNAEGDTKFGTERRYSDIKDRLEQQHRQFTTAPDEPVPPKMMEGKNVAQPVPKVSAAPEPLEPLPPLKPVPLKVPPSTRGKPAAPTPPGPTNAALASEAASHLSHAAGVPGLARAAHFAMRHAKSPAGKGTLRFIRDQSRRAATPAAVVGSQQVRDYQNQEDQ